MSIEHGIFTAYLGKGKSENIRFTVENGRVSFPDGLSYGAQKYAPLIIDTIRGNRGLPLVKRVYQGTQAPQWC